VPLRRYPRPVRTSPDRSRPPGDRIPTRPLRLSSQATAGPRLYGTTCRPSRFRSSGLNSIAAIADRLRQLTHMYGPAARCKRFCRSGGIGSCVNVSGFSLEQSLRAIMDISARAISLAARHRDGPCGSPGFARVGKTDPPCRFILSQTGRVEVLTSSISSFLSFAVPLFAPEPFLRPGLRSDEGAARRDGQGRPSLLRCPMLWHRRPALTVPSTAPTIMRAGAAHRSSHTQSLGPCKEPPRQSAPACWRARSPRHGDGGACALPQSTA
jgi:hypothetical protein